MNNKKTLIKTILILGWLFTTIQSNEFVFAQTSTPPPPPPIFLPTVISNRPDVSNTQCPPGNPTGYGVKTPSPLWIQLCGHCLDGFGFAPTKTPIITPTPTQVPNTTSRLFVLYDYFKKNGEGDYVQDFDDPYWYYGHSELNTYEVIPIYAINDVANSSYTVGIDFDWWFKYYARGAPYCTGDYYYRLRVKNSALENTGSLIVHFPDGENVDITVAHNETKYYDFLDTLSSVAITKEHQIDLRVEISMANGGRIDYRDWEIDINKYGCPTANQDKENGFEWRRGTFPPEVEPTPSPGYCSSIKEEGEEGSFEDIFGFGYDGFVLGALHCVDIGPYDFNFLGMDFGIPYLAHLCTQEISIGEINMLGANISLDAFIIILAVAWVIRNLFIS